MCLHKISPTEINLSLALDFFLLSHKTGKNIKYCSLKVAKILDVEVCVSVLALKYSKNSFFWGSLFKSIFKTKSFFFLHDTFFVTVFFP